MLAGGLLAYSTVSALPHPAKLRVPISPKFRDAAAIAGLLLIAMAIALITPQTKFPGYAALLPTLGTYLILFAGPATWLNRTILSQRVLVWFGLISYPLYLWHWPLLAFAHNLVIFPSVKLRIGLVLISVALAWLTYRFVEVPIRFGARKTIGPVLALCAGMLCIGAFGVYDYGQSGVPSRLKDGADYAAYFEGYLYNPKKHTVEREQIAQNQCNFYDWTSPFPTFVPRENIDADCYTRHAPKSVLIVGDSVAADLYYGLKEVLPSDISTLLIFSSGCQVRPVDEPNLRIDSCNMTNYFALNQIKKDPPDIVLMSSNNSFKIDYIRAVTRKIKSYGVKHVFVLGERPHWKPYLYKIIMNEYWDFTPRYIPDHQDPDMMALGEAFESKVTPDEPFEYVEQHSAFCNADGCMTYLGDDRREGLITFNTVHLRPFASVYLAKKQLVPLILNRLQSDTGGVPVRTKPD